MSKKQKPIPLSVLAQALAATAAREALLGEDHQQAVPVPYSIGQDFLTAWEAASK